MPPLKHILCWLKFILWVVFLAIRLTVIIIPYTLFKDESKNNYELVVAFQVIFEVVPVLLGLIDLMNTSQQKAMDMSNLNPETQSTTNQFLMSVNEMISVKKPSLRIYMSLFVYYPLLAIACATLIGTAYEQKMSNEQALKLPTFFVH